MRYIALRHKVFDVPNQTHKTHLEPVPYLGGIAIVLGTVFTTYAAIIASNFDLEMFLLASSILLPALLMSLIGLIDDIKQLKPWPRFLVQNVIAFISSWFLLITNTLGTPFGLPVLDLAISMLWLVGITNSINFFDNIDGGASGTIAVSGLALAIIAFATGQSLIAAMSLVLAGATIGFLLWNKPPARIYMGDSGALFLGILIASLTVRLDSSQELGRLGLLIPVLILAIPILDTSISVIKRLKRGVSVFQGGKDHLSHRLMRLGFQKKNAVITLWVGSTYFSSIAVWLSLANFRNYGPLISLVTISWISLFAFFVFTQDTD